MAQLRATEKLEDGVVNLAVREFFYANERDELAARDDKAFEGIVDSIHHGLEQHPNPVKRHVFFEAALAEALVARGERRRAIQALREAEHLDGDIDYHQRPRDEMLADLLIDRREIDDAKEIVDGLLARSKTALDRANTSGDAEAIQGAAFDRMTALGLQWRALLVEGKPDQAGIAVAEQRRVARKAGLTAEYRQLLVSRADTLLSMRRARDAKQLIDDELAADEESVSASLLLRLGLAEHAIETVEPMRARRSTEVLRRVLDKEPRPTQLRRRALLKLFEIAVSDETVDVATSLRDELVRDGGSELWDSPLFAAPATRLGVLENQPVEELRVLGDRLKRIVDREFERIERTHAADEPAGFFASQIVPWAIGEYVDLLLAIAEKEDRTDGPSEALEVVLRAQQFNSIARALEAPPCSVEDVQRELVRPDSGILVYLPWRRCTHLFVVDSAKVACHRLPGRPRTVHPAKRLVFEFNMRPRRAKELGESVVERWRSSSAQALEMLLPDEVLATMRAWSGATLVGLDMLRSVPFPALLLPSGELLGEVCAIDNLGSLPLGVALARRRASQGELPPASLTVFGCTTTDAPTARDRGIESVAFPKDRLAPILDSYGADRARVLVDDEVTTAALRGLDWTGSRVTQILAHGVRDRSREFGAGVALRDEEFYYDDFRERSVTGLAILSVCEGGSTPSRLGDGQLGTSLGGALMRSGADAVIQSPREIELYGHLEFMTTFHRTLAGGASPAAALRDARQAHVEDGWLARFYRAQLQVFGLGQLPVAAAVTQSTSGDEPSPSPQQPPAQPWWTLVAAAAGVALILVALVRLRRR